MMVFLYLSTMLVEATLTNDQDVAESGATVTITLADRAGTEVPGITWPQTMAETATAGTYRYTAPADLQVQPNTRYVAKVKAVAVGGAERYAEVPFRVEVDDD